MNNTMLLNKVSLPYKIFLVLIALLTLANCKKVHQSSHVSDTGRKLQVELRMPVAWQKIVIGPKNAKEYPKVPRTFSMFMTGESTVALKRYLIISSKISPLSQQHTVKTDLKNI